MRSNTLTASERLHQKAQFQNVYQNGKKVVTRYFILFFLESRKTDRRPRLGLTVTKSVGNSVERNRIRRQIREFFRQHKPLCRSGDYVFKARIRASSAKRADLREDIERAIVRLATPGRG